MFELLIGLGIGAVIAYYTITHYNHIRAFLADLCRAFGFLGKWVRRKSVEEKYENIINGAVNDYNSNFENKIISNCKIKWINKDTEDSYYKDGKAIICLKFDKNDQELNFYNATYAFTKTALLPTTRNFVRKTSQKAIDLNLTKIFIKDYDRKVLRVFNQKYQTEELVVKEAFSKFEETEKRGLFTTLLIPELYFLGEILETTTPSDKIELEIENFFNWFYELATRNKDDKTVLSYRSEHFKIGVILVANLETYNTYGIDAYTKWADKYASEHFGAVYLLARGTARAAILKEVVSELIDKRGFDQINKKVTTLEVDEQGQKIEISCYCLKPNLAKVQFHAWEKIKNAYQGKLPISGIVSIIKDKSIIVNIYGIEFEIQKEKLSKTEIPNLSKYFYIEQELSLNIESFTEDDCWAVFNNIDTDTDPSLLIEQVLKNHQTIKVIVDGVQVDREGQERGLKTFCKEINKRVFIPKKYCSYSRFISLSSTFQKGDEIEVLLHGFSMEFANYFGEIKNLENPLLRIKEYQELNRYSAIVKEITENYITTELLPGLECRIYSSELSWDNKITTQNFNIDDRIELIIIKNDTQNYKIVGSIKRLEKSKNEIFYTENENSVLQGKVKKIYNGIGLKFESIDCSFSGFVHIKELMWGYCCDIEDSFPIGSMISIIPFEFNYHNDEIQYSVKRVLRNDYDTIASNLIIGEDNIYQGTINGYHPNIARVEVAIENYILQGYIHKAEISNLVYIENDDIEYYLPIGTNFGFCIKRKDVKNKVVELSRKKILNSIDLEYGETISARVVKIAHDKAYFYEDEIEGIISENFKHLKINDKPDVYLLDRTGLYGV